MGYGYVLDPFLGQGDFPEHQTRFSPTFNCLVLCAFERQPPNYVYPDVVVLRAPIDDSLLTHAEAKIASEVAKNVALRIRHGQKVLVTCAMGRNRSGLVSGLTLITLGFSAEQAIRRVRRARVNALSNPSFTAYLRLYEQVCVDTSQHALV